MHVWYPLSLAKSASESNDAQAYTADARRPPPILRTKPVRSASIVREPTLAETGNTSPVLYPADVRALPPLRVALDWGRSLETGGRWRAVSYTPGERRRAAPGKQPEGRLPPTYTPPRATPLDGLSPSPHRVADPHVSHLSRAHLHRARADARLRSPIPPYLRMGLARDGSHVASPRRLRSLTSPCRLESTKRDSPGWNSEAPSSAHPERDQIAHLAAGPQRMPQRFATPTEFARQKREPEKRPQIPPFIVSQAALGVRC
ncbi:hypothetical protein DFH08DRAFT_1080018 [Mycena albidolilacea]|uniref:Uncharacterized protein n=1 Tax=Mycena albidolilacea TaxID=1033008 RepID=A0AAD7ESL7_9AGAR|nr:hypothetical protein DFH08DRAFT_1080018 [Mycena albidolilacea]